MISSCLRRLAPLRHPLLARLVVSTAFAMLLAPAPHAFAYCRLTTSMPVPGLTCSERGAVLAWHRQCITYSVSVGGGDVPSASDARAAIARSFDTWLAVDCGSHSVGISLEETKDLGECTVPEYNTHASNANTVFFVDDWAERGLPDEVFGLTLVWHELRTGEIFDVDMQLNASLGPVRICGESCASGVVDLENVVTHEAGHFLGLGHSFEAGATMHAKADVGETAKRVLTQDDRNGLCSIYGSFPKARCEERDFVPHHGFAAKCGRDESKRARAAGCSALPHSTHGTQAGDLVACALAIAWSHRRRSRAHAARRSVER